jgi:hypothetical protein
MMSGFQKLASDFEKKAEYEVTQIIRRFKEKHPNLNMVYLPNVSQERKVRNIFVTMEPSLGLWAKTEKEGKKKVGVGFRNFLFSVEDMILHFCASEYLEGEYRITDVSKIATSTKDAGKIRKEAWAKQRDLLNKELELFGSDKYRIIPVGDTVGAWVRENRIGHAALKKVRIIEPVLHYSRWRAKHRKKAAQENPEGFTRFREDWDQDKFREYAAVCMERMKNCESEKRSLRNKLIGQITDSRMHLAFTYKCAFEKIEKDSKPRASNTWGDSMGRQGFVTLLGAAW